MSTMGGDQIVPLGPGPVQRVVADTFPMGFISAEPPHDRHRTSLSRILWLRKWIILAATLLGAGAGAAYHFHLAAPVYSSFTRIYVQPSGPKIVSGDDGGGKQSGNYLNTEAQIIRSGKVLGPLLREGGPLTQLRTFAGDYSPYERLSQGLTVRPGKDDDIITISFQSRYPEDATEVVNQIANEYQSYQKDRRLKSAEGVLGIIQTEIDRRRGQLDQARRELMKFREAHPELEFQGEKANIIIQKLGSLYNSLTAADLECVEAKTYYEAVCALADVAAPAFPNEPNALRPDAGKGPIPIVSARRPAEGPTSTPSDEEANQSRQLLDLAKMIAASSPKDPNLARRIPVRDAVVAERINQFFDAKRGGAISAQDETTLLQNELNSLRVQRSQFAESGDARYRNPALVRIDQRMDELRKLISERQMIRAAGYLEMVRQQYEGALKRYNSILEFFNEQFDYAKGFINVHQELAKLQVAFDDMKRAVDQLEERKKELNLIKEGGALTVNILEPASKAQLIWPDLKRVMAISITLGVLVGMGLALLRHRMDARVTSAEEAGDILGVPVMGALPHLKGDLAPDSVGRNVLEDPFSGMAEAYRGIRTALHFGLRGIRAKTILVTSPAPQEGKSTLISNLAVSLAHVGRRVLVMDADLRQPRQHAIFSVANEIGLANVLAGETPVERAIHRFDHVAVDVMPAGRTERHSYERLNGQPMVELLAALAERYDMVLIDSPPVMSVTDPLVLAAICDVTILVVRAGRSHRAEAAQAREALLSVGARVVGTVVTGVKTRSGRYYPYYHQYYTKRPGESEPTAEAAARPGDSDKA